MKKIAGVLFKNEFFIFLVVGVVNTLFSYGVYAFFIFLKFHYSIASLLQIIFSTIFNFNTIGRLVFKNNDKKLVFRFICVCIILYLAYVLGIKALNYIKLNDYAAGAIMVFPVALLSYFLNKTFVFKAADAAGKNAGDSAAGSS